MPAKHTGGKMHSRAPPQVHIPSVHPSALSPQELPHPPQLLASVRVFLQVPLQHSSLPLQVRPQAPQWATELLVSLQEPSQHFWLPAQAGPLPHLHTPSTQLSPSAQAGSQGTSVVQVPATHVSSDEQVTPQPPQLLGSESVLMQAPPQHPRPLSQGGPPPHRHAMSMHVSPGPQAGEHSGISQAPPTQTSPASVSQGASQKPQWSVEVCRSAQVPPQQVSPVPQASAVPQRQEPAAQVLPSGAQMLLHAPQLS